MVYKEYLMDKIYIRDLEFIGYHGVLKKKKKLGQKILCKFGTYH